MSAKKRASFVPCLVLVMLILVGVGCGSKPTPTSALQTKSPALPISTPTLPVARCPSAVHSPHGSVPFGAKACSPDGTKYAREIEPKNQGRIGVFDVHDDELLLEIKMRETNNDLKGLAWSPDSHWLAVMYHHGGGGYIAIVNAVTGERAKHVRIDQWYHRMKFSEDGTSILAENDTLEIGSLHTQMPTATSTLIHVSGPTSTPAPPTPEPVSVEWAQTSGPPGVVWSLAINPTEPRILYAGTEGRGVFKSEDGGNSWRAVNTGLTNSNVRSLVLDPTKPDTLYAGTDGGIFKSEDGGNSWKALNPEPTIRRITSLVLEPTHPSTIYAGTEFDGVFKTYDEGNTWNAIGTEPTMRDITSIILDPTIPWNLYVGTAHSGVFKSKDGGNSWTNIGLIDKRIKSLAFDFIDSFLYVATEDGVFRRYKSLGEKYDWEEVNTYLTNRNINTLVLVPTSPTALYAGTNGGGIFRTEAWAKDRWTPVNRGLTTFVVWALVFDPANPDTVYAGTSGGIFKSEDGGNLWVEASAGLTTSDVNALVLDPMKPDTLYAATDGGVFKSEDGGDSWIGMNTGLLARTPILSLAIDPKQAGVIYAGTDYGGYGGDVYQSSDGGGHWAAMSIGLHPNRGSITQLAIDPQRPNNIYANLRIPNHHAGLYKSTDGGGHWEEIMYIGYGAIRSLAIDIKRSDHLYVWACGGTTPWSAGLFKSIDGGSTWIPIADGITELEYNCVNSLALDLVDPDTLYVGSEEGVFKSTDGGTNWTKVNLDPMDIEVYTLVISAESPGAIYAGTNMGVYWSSDEGQNWHQTRGIPTNVAVRALAIDPRSPNLVYAGTAYHGVYRSLTTLMDTPTPSPTRTRASATLTPSPTRVPPTATATPTLTPRPTSTPTNTPTLTPTPTNTPTSPPPYTRVTVRTDTGIHCQVIETKTGRVVLTTWAQYPTFNDVKACKFSSDWRKFAAAYHYGHAGNYTWIGVWSTETGEFLYSKTEPGWIGIPAGVFDQ